LNQAKAGRRAFRPHDGWFGVRVGVALAAEGVAARTVGARRVAVGEAAAVLEAHLAIALEARRAIGLLGVRLAVALAVRGRGGETVVTLLHARRAVGAACLAAATTDGRHVFTIATHRYAALAAGRTCLARVELVSRALLVRGATTLAGDLTLLAPVHGREAAVAARARLPGVRRLIATGSVVTARRARAAAALIGHFTLPLTVGAKAALFAVRSDRHYNSSWKCEAPA
jgi:hypothetical protein